MCIDTEVDALAGTAPGPGGGLPDHAADPLPPGLSGERLTESDRFANLLAVYIRGLTLPRGLDEGHAGGCG